MIIRRTAAALFSTLVFTAPALADSKSAPPADCSVGAIPDRPVSGTVNGTPFVPKEITVHLTKDGMVVDKVHLDRWALAIEVDGIFNALTVNTMVPGGKKPDGRVFRELAVDSIGAQPAAAEGTPEIQGWELALEAAGVDVSFTGDTASIRIEWGTLKGNTLPGKIHFCNAGSHSEIAGSFNATVN